MHFPLSGIPVERRRHLAAVLGLFAVLFVAVGVVATTGTAPGVVRVFSVVALSVAAVLGAVAWGVIHSVKVDLARARLDTAIEDAMASHAATGPACGCGHEHDSDEMHVTGEPCGLDGTGTECARSCETCLLAALRPSPTRSRAARLALARGAAPLAPTRSSKAATQSAPRRAAPARTPR